MPYLNITEVESGLSALASAYPGLTELITLPNSTHEGRTSHALRIGLGSPSTKDGVLFIGGVHAREWGSCEICINFAADLLEAYTLGTGLVYGGKSFTSAQVKAIVKGLHVIVFPLVNPDGRHYSQTVYSMWRKNRNPLSASACEGVDINRNYDFLWDFPNLCSPPVPGWSNDVHDATSTDPCDDTYHGTAACSEPETKNVCWLMDAYPRIRWFVDIHSYSRLVLHVWGHDNNQTTDPAMNFMNAAYNAVRGVKGDTAYKEYIPADDLAAVTALANRLHDAIEAVRGESYTAEPSVDLYPTAGTSGDYAYSRHFVNPGKNKVHGFCIEWGTQFQPPWSEMENIILDISSGLVEFCLAAPCQGGLISVTKETATIDFNDVPEGETAARAAVFSVDSCAAVTFQITSGPTVTSGPPGTSFGTPLGTSVSLGVAASMDTRKAHVWITYTGTSAGDTASGTVSIRCVETGDEWTIPITANTINRPTAAVMLALDRSNSMTFDSGFGPPLTTRNDVLKYSAQPLVEVIHEDDALGIVTFDHDAYDVVPPMPPTPAGPTGFGAGRNTARAHILGHTPNPAGWTSIGDGVELAHTRLAPITGYDIKAILVFTDGHENRPKFLADVADINNRVYAIGLGTAAEIRPSALNALTNGTGGYLLLTGALDADRYFQLSKYFLQILAGVKNSDIVLDPEARILPGHEHKVPFHLNEADVTSDVILLTPFPQAVRFTLETPAGDLVDPAGAAAAPGASFFAGSNTAFYRLTLPVPVGAAGAGPGRWNAVLTLDDRYWKRYLSSLKDVPSWFDSVSTHGLRYALTVHAYSSLRLRASLTQDSYEPGARMTLRATLTQHGIPLETGARVHAELTRPDRTSAVLQLTETDKGIFEAATGAAPPGVYRFRVCARGTTLRGLPFTREQEVTGVAWQGGDDPPPSGKGDPWEHWQRLCRLLTCLVSSKNVSPALEKRLAELGLNLAGFRRCLEEFCAGRDQRATATSESSKEKLVRLVAELGPQGFEVLEKVVKEMSGGC